MANGNEEFVDVTTTEQSPQDTGEFTDVTSGEVDADQVDQEYNYIAGNADSWFSIVQDPTTGGYGIEVPDIDFSFAKFDEETDDDTPEKLTAVESLKNTWNNSLDQLSLVDDRFYWLSEQLFGDEDSLTFKEAEARISASEDAAAEKGIEGGTLALSDIPDAFEEEGFIGGLAHTGAAITNAVASFGTTAIESAATGGVGLAVDMVSSSVRDYAKARAEEEGISIEEASRNLGAETIIPVGLGALAYSFEKAGLKGVGKAIKGMAPSAKKALFNVMNASGKEGATELAQGVVESFNQGFAGKRSLDAATESVGEFWENEALETFLQGAVGGGVTAGGGRSARKAASQLRSNEAERTIVETTEKISKIDEQLNDPNIPDDQKKILKRTRTALDNKFKEAIKEPNKDIRKLNDDQINKINEKGDKINKLKKELDEFNEGKDGIEASYIVEDDINDRIQREIDGINDIYAERSTTNIREEDGSYNDRGLSETSKAASEQAQRIYEEQGEAGIGEILETQTGTVNKYRNIYHNKLTQDQKQRYDAESYGADLQVEIYKLVKSYNPESGTPLGAWINKWFPLKAKELLDKNVPDSIRVDEEKGSQIAAPIEEEGPELEPINIAARLKVKPEQFEKAKSEARKVLSGRLKAPSDKTFGQPFAASFRDNLRPVIDNTFGKGKKFKEYVENNYDLLWDSIPQEVLASANEGTDYHSWSIQQPSKQEFIDYFTDPSVPVGTRSKRKTRLASVVA